MRCRILTAAIAAVVALGSALSAARAADLQAEPVRPTDKTNCSLFWNYFLYGDPRDCPGDEFVPACDSGSVVSAAMSFANRARAVYRIPRVTELSNVREAPQRVPNWGELDRRYCEATATLDTGQFTTAYFFLEEDGGAVGLAWTVYLCLDGYDDWRVYDGRCRVARPAPTQ